MKLFPSTLIALFIATLFIVSCKPEPEEPNREDYIKIIDGIKYYSLNESILEWLSPFDEEDMEIKYSNDLGEEAIVTVKSNHFDKNNWVDCTRENAIGQCNLKSVLLEFDMGSDTLMHLKMVLFGIDKLIIMPYDQAAANVQGLLRYDEEAMDWANIQPDNFEISISQSMSYQSNSYPGFSVSNSSLEGLFAVPPLAFDFLKGVGITEWTDRAGVIWNLN